MNEQKERELISLLQTLVDEYGGDSVVEALHKTTWGAEYDQRVSDAMLNFAKSVPRPPEVSAVRQTGRWSDLKVSKK